MKTTYCLRISTENGDFIAIYSERGLAELRFPSRAAVGDCAAPESVQRWHKLTAAAVQAILEGEAVGELPQLDLAGHSEFQQKVWAELRKLGPGETVSYGQLAATLGIPAGARAVGGACGANPIPLIIPCHRVLAANGGLGGFSGGLDWKRRLLKREGVQAREDLQEDALGSHSRFNQEQLAHF